MPIFTKGMAAPDSKLPFDFSESDPEGRPFSDFDIPTRADYTRGTLLNGERVRYLSKHLIHPWPLPIPGRSLIFKTAKKQTDPVDTGSIYTPPAEAHCHWMPPEAIARAPGVPPTPELDAKVKDAKLLVREEARLELEDLMGYHKRVIAVGDMALALIAKSPELLLQYATEGAPANSAPALPEKAAPEQTATEPRASEPRAEVLHDVDALKGIFDECQRDVEAAARESKPGPAGPGIDQAARESKPGPAGRGNDQATPALPNAHAGKPRGPRLPYVKAGTLGRLVSLISLGERSATHAAALVTEIMDLKCKNIDEAREVDIKSRFFEHRAVAVIKNKLCAIDHEFEDLGFGGWMPFRYIDQWLQFVSLERKLMAANNLICPKGPNHWRRFIEETPEVETDEDEGPHGAAKLPKSWGLQKKNQAVESLTGVYQLAREKSGRSAQLLQEFEARFGRKPR